MLSKAGNVLFFELFNLISCARKEDFTDTGMNQILSNSVINEKEYEELFKKIDLELEGGLVTEIFQYNRFKDIIGLGTHLFQRDMRQLFDSKKIMNMLDTKGEFFFDKNFDTLYTIDIAGMFGDLIGYYRTAMSIVNEATITIAKDDTLLKSAALKQEILKVIMDSGVDVFNIDPQAVQNTLLCLPEMRRLIIKSALEIFLDERSFLLEEMPDAEKKYLLCNVTMCLIGCGRYSSLEKDLLIRAYDFFQIDLEYVGEFETLLMQKLKVIKQLSSINNELDNLITE